LEAVCEYWASDNRWAHAIGLSFENGRSIAPFASLLEFVMQHQDAFLRVINPGHDGIVQVYPPSDKESSAAKQYMRDGLRLVADHDKNRGPANVRLRTTQSRFEVLRPQGMNSAQAERSLKAGEA
jgi:hypothetical protein